MKKTIACLMILALLISAIAIPAFADQPPAMPGNGQNNQNGQQPPAMPAGGQNGPNNQNGQQPPAMPGNGQNGPNNQNGQQPPAMPGNSQNDQNSQNGQQPPAMPGNGQNAPGGEPEKRLDFEQLAKDNVISQEISDAIMAYMKDRAPQAFGDGTAPAQGSEPPAQGSEPPAKPEGIQGAGSMEEDLLKELLESQTITQETYELLTGLLEASSAATESATDNV